MYKNLFISNFIKYIRLLNSSCNDNKNGYSLIPNSNKDVRLSNS